MPRVPLLAKVRHTEPLGDFRPFPKNYLKGFECKHAFPSAQCPLQAVRAWDPAAKATQQITACP